MFKQVYESQTVPYRTRESIPGSIACPSSLLESPRLYGEYIYLLIGIFVHPEKTATANHVVHVICNMRINKSPCFQMRNIVFDGVTGEYLRDDPAPPAITTLDMIEGADGSLWIKHGGFGDWYEHDPITLSPITDGILDSSKYGITFGTVSTPMIDRVNNILIRGDEDSGPYVKVHEFISGAQINEINVSGYVVQIIPESDKHAYVYCNNGIINLINYVDGEVLSAFKAPAPTNTAFTTFTGSQKFAFDRFMRRLLAFQLMADQDDGSNPSTIKGWYPAPLPVRIQKPIPLVAPRMGRDVPYLTRLFGDAGEPVAGVSAHGAITGVTADVAPGISDNNGHAILRAKSSTAGSATLTVSADVIDS